jgi:choline monooxygenase
MLSADQIDQLKDVALAKTGLGGAFFTCEAVFAEERKTLLHGGWMCVGTRDDAGSPSSIFPISIAGVDLLLARDREGILRCFFNHCSHRGAILVDKSRKNCPTIVCPYHSWTYGLTGELRKTPHVGGMDINEVEGLDPAKLPLREVRLGEWGGLTFANVSGTAEPFETFIAPMAERMRDYDLSKLHCSGEVETIVEANWKIAAENFVESYHLPWIHPSMNRFNPMDDHYQILGGDTYLGQGLLGLVFKDEAANVLPRFPNLKPQQLTTGESHFLFPNVFFGVMIEMAYVVILNPDRPHRTHERVVVMVNGVEVATDPKLAGARDVLLQRIVDVNAEDIGIVENLQRGRSSPAFVGGQFSNVQEQTSRQLQRAYAIRMLKGAGQVPPDVCLDSGEVHLPRRATLNCS